MLILTFSESKFTNYYPPWNYKETFAFLMTLGRKKLINSLKFVFSFHLEWFTSKTPPDK